MDDPLVQPVSGWDIGLFLADVIHGKELIIFTGSPSGNYQWSMNFVAVLVLTSQSHPYVLEEHNRQMEQCRLPFARLQAESVFEQVLLPHCCLQSW